MCNLFWFSGFNFMRNRCVLYIFLPHFALVKIHAHVHLMKCSGPVYNLLRTIIAHAESLLEFHLHLVTFANSWRMKSGSRIFGLALNFPQNSSSALWKFQFVTVFINLTHSPPSTTMLNQPRITNQAARGFCAILLNILSSKLFFIRFGGAPTTVCTNLSSISPPGERHSFSLAAQINNFLNSQIASDGTFEMFSFFLF